MEDEMFNELIESMQQAVEIRRGELKGRVTSYSLPDVKAIRTRAGMKQDEFAQAVGVSPSLVQSWEQHKRFPSGAALKLLRLLERNPAMMAVVSAA